MGTKMMAAISMMNSVVGLDEPSNTVRLCDGWVDEGSKNGKTERPAVLMTPASESALAMKATPWRKRSRTNAPMAPRKA